MNAPSAMNDHHLPGKLFTLSRRRTLKLGMMSGVGRLLPPIAQIQAAEPRTKPPTWAKPTMHSYDNYGWLRGFNVVPSWGARIEQVWWEYDSQRFREEIGRARQVRANCIRLWIECTAWMAGPKKVTAHFLDAVAAIDEAGMKTMHGLFNRWHNRDGWDHGGTSTEDLARNRNPKLDDGRCLSTGAYPVASTTNERASENSNSETRRPAGIHLLCGPVGIWESLLHAKDRRRGEAATSPARSKENRSCFDKVANANRKPRPHPGEHATRQDLRHRNESC